MKLPKIKKHVQIKESDVTVISEEDKFIKMALENLLENRRILEKFIQDYPEFEKTYKPYFIKDPPKIISLMQSTAEIFNVGPMAAVAGALADLMDYTILDHGAKIAVVENGGEIIINSSQDIFIGLYSMTTILKGKVGFMFKGHSSQLGIGTSSGTFGHANSLGKADTVTIFADNATIADTAATMVANSVIGQNIEDSIGKALEIADTYNEIKGAFISRGKYVGKSGYLPEIISIDDSFEEGYLKSKIDNLYKDDIKLF